MHDLVHDLARLVLADELILGESKLGNTDGSSCRYALFDDCSKRMESYTDSPAKIKALRFLDCGKIGLHGDAFSSAKYIRVLDLSDCFIQELPDSVGQLKQLRYLNAPKIQHRMIPNSITKLLKLMYLSLRGSSALLEMPDSIGDLEDLMYLDLSCCSELEKLPESFSRLNKLVHLDLSNCTNVTGVSESLPSLTNLEFLDISYCWNIRELPEHFGSLLKLKYLNMSGCDEIEELPGSIGNIKNLVHLDLSHCCQVKVTPQVLDCLTKLQYLNLSQCGCIDGTKVAEALGNLTQLRQLHLSGFMDTMYHDESTFSTSLECISTLSYLEHLDISCNIGLLHLPERFGSLGKLHTLDLSDCSSLRFLPESIAQMDSLKRVYAKDCRPLVTQLLVARGLHKSLTPLMELDVQAGELKGGNLVLFHAVDVTAVKIYGLDEVESFEEAQSIKLVAKKGIEKLRLVWSVSSYHVRIVEDSEVLGGLEPPSTIESLDINGYNGIIFPDWLMCISHDNFPNLVSMPSVAKIDEDFCGGTVAFSRLESFSVFFMENLEVWNTRCSCGGDGASGYMFPSLRELQIFGCPKLRLKPCPPKAEKWTISLSDAVISSWDALQDTTKLPSFLQSLELDYCESMTALPQWEIMGSLTSLQELHIWYCSSIESLPESIQQLTNLEKLQITGCPTLKRWCQIEENKLKLVHIKEK
ncbi:hypothetical protein SORBI_3007G071950 [Sorghum bicolor]|uniref:Uncharacterized protein n=1 Tax=Sorghum bicolor TaxID=4558 RepID=A0A1Z5R9D1_SORBI|nr:hypothetical protein SORBI_3007G071950 [Sorghum bicolor]